MAGAADARPSARLDRFWRILLVIVVAALAVRVAYVAGAKSGPCPVRVEGELVGSYPSECARGDQLWYNSVANQLARGGGFTDRLATLGAGVDEAPPTAAHPPLAVFVLAGVSWLAARPPLDWVVGDALATNVREQRFAMALIGTLGVALVGLLGRRLGGDRAGWAAAAIMAFNPNAWVNDGLLMSETVTSLVVVVVLLLGLRLLDDGSLSAAATLGVACGLAALARAELILLLPLLAAGAALVRRGRRPLAVAAVVVAGGAMVVAPWVVYNVERFAEPTSISTNDGIALAGSNCAKVYYGGALGLTYLQPPCIDRPHPPGDESEVAVVYRRRALDYMKEHAARLPVVAAARVGRTWSLYVPLQMRFYNVGEGRERWVSTAGLWFHYPLLGLAAAGAVVVGRQNRRRLWVVALPVLVVTVGVALTYGQTRFRAAAEPSLAVLAAVAVAGASKVRSRSAERVSRGRPADGPG